MNLHHIPEAGLDKIRPSELWPAIKGRDCIKKGIFKDNRER